MHVFFLDTKEEMMEFSTKYEHVGNFVCLNSIQYKLLRHSSGIDIPALWEDPNGFKILCMQLK